MIRTSDATRRVRRLHARWFVVACVLVLLGVGLAWRMPQASAGAGADRAAPADPFVATVARIRPSVVAVGSYRINDTPTVQYSGTGFVIGDGRVVATNAHVVQGLRQRDRLDSMRVFFPDGAPVAGRVATVIAEDSFHDVALLRFEGPAAAAMPLDPTLEAPQGQEIGVLGYPIGTALGLVPATHKGVVAAVVPAVLPLPKGVKLTPELAEAIRRPYNLYQLDLVIYPGNSGSPLFDGRDGRVYGIINKTLATRTREHMLENPSAIGYAVPAKWIHDLLTRTQIQGASATSPTSAPGAARE